MTTFERIVARVVLAGAIVVVVLLLLRNVASTPAPSRPVQVAVPALVTSDGVPIERYQPLVAKSVPVEIISPPVRAPVSVVPDAAPGPIAVKRVIQAEPPRKRKAYGMPDICRGKGRYWVNGGRSWRCRRA